MHLQPETGFRESYRIIGETVVTVQDYTSGRHFECRIVCLLSRRSSHPDGSEAKTIKAWNCPNRSHKLIDPKDSKNIIVAGRQISSDRLANSALRVQAACMGMGQAAGATAALAVRNKTTPSSVPRRRFMVCTQTTMRSYRKILEYFEQTPDRLSL